ncbi:hypothetical protein BDM02DRAFT_3118124, partial [Thelephora ganbajun]
VSLLLSSTGTPDGQIERFGYGSSKAQPQVVLIGTWALTHPTQYTPHYKACYIGKLRFRIELMNERV